MSGLERETLFEKTLHLRRRKTRRQSVEKTPAFPFDRRKIKRRFQARRFDKTIDAGVGSPRRLHHGPSVIAQSDFFRLSLPAEGLESKKIRRKARLLHRADPRA